MKISTIIPVYNEESTIETLQQSLRFLKEESEIIFVDGGSTDRTLALIHPEYRAGCFGIRFRSNNILMKCCQTISNHRIKDRKIMFGDQGIFMRRDLFFEIGGFPELPIMEDYQISLTLKEKKVALGMAKSRIYTSDRRFAEGGRLRVMLKMNWLRVMYRMGVDIQKIAEMYRDIR